VISNAKNKQNDGSRFSIYTTWNFNTEKMYFLIAGYTAMPRKTEKQDIKGIATGFRNAMFGMALLLIIGFCSKIV
jgi:hypothetical protein